MTNTLYATVRIEKLTGKPAIFYRNDCKGTLSCYTQEEQHSDAGLAYYRNNTRPARTDEERAQCDALAARYACLCERFGERLEIRARLTDNNQGSK